MDAEQCATPQHFNVPVVKIEVSRSVIAVGSRVDSSSGVPAIVKSGRVEMGDLGIVSVSGVVVGLGGGGGSRSVRFEISVRKSQGRVDESH